MLDVRSRTWPWTEAGSHTADIFDKLTICLVSGLDHSSRVAGYSSHDGIVNANVEFTEESMNIDQSVLWDLELGSVQSSINILEAPMKLLLDLREAKGRSTERRIEWMNKQTVLQ